MREDDAKAVATSVRLLGREGDVDDVLWRIHDDIINPPDVIRPVHPADLSLAAQLTNGVKIDLHGPLFFQDE